MQHPRSTVVRAALPFAALATVAAVTVPAVTASAGSEQAASVTHGRLVELNHSGVTGTVTLVERAGQIRVNLDASGLEPMIMHMQHIHGFGDGTQASCPDMSQAGADGILSFAEGLPSYGPVKVTLGHDETSGSTLDYSRTFTHTDLGAGVGSLGALGQYVIVVHGLTVDGSVVPSLPVACATLASHGS